MAERERSSMIHYDVDPFAPPVDQRDPARRLRGRLASPVTVWTAFAGDESPSGITVSSLVVVEGQRGAVVGLIDPLSMFWAALEETRRFVVHVLDREQRRLADQMAGRYPGPDARFENVKLLASAWGPVVEDVATRAYCSLDASAEVGDAVVVTGSIERIDLEEMGDPLVYFRGAYHDLVPRARR